MDTDTGTPRIRPITPCHPRQQRGGMAAVVLSALLVLIGCVLVAASLKQEHDMEVETLRFQAVPVCTGGPGMPLASMPCRLNEPMVVTNKWVRYRTRGNRDYNLDLRSDRGDTYEVAPMPGSGVWTAADAGQVVSTQLWQGKVISVSVGGHTASTGYYPGVPPDGGAWSFRYTFVWASVLLLCLFVLMLTSACRHMARGQ